MSNLGCVFYMALFCFGTYLMALAPGYFWARAMHYPFTMRQRKMLNYYALFISSVPVLGPFMVALTRWLLPVEESIDITLLLLAVWMVIVLFIVRRMSRPGGRLSHERQE